MSSPPLDAGFFYLIYRFDINRVRLNDQGGDIRFIPILVNKKALKDAFNGLNKFEIAKSPSY